MRLWDVATKKLVRRYEHGAMVLSVGVIAGGRQAVSGSADGSLRLWNLPGR
jgi:WD40 repeat protein